MGARSTGPETAANNTPVVLAAERYAEAYAAALTITNVATAHRDSFDRDAEQNAHFAALQAMQLAVGWERGV